MKEHNDFEAWIEHAEDDFRNSGKLIRGSRPSIYGTCFHLRNAGDAICNCVIFP